MNAAHALLSEPAQRAQPHNIDAEKSVLGSVFIKPATFRQIAATLEVDDFFLPAHREIYESMLALDRRRQPIDVIAVADELKTGGMSSRLEGGESYLLALANVVPTAENSAHYGRLVKEKATLRRLIAACAEVQSSAYGDFGEFDAFTAHARAAILRVTEAGVHARLATAAEHAAAETEPLPNPISTGIEALDVLLGGGMYPEATYVTPGATGRGKSALAAQLARDISLSMPVVYVTTELRARQVVARVVAGVLRRPWLDLWRHLHLERTAIAGALADRRLLIADGAHSRNLDPAQLADEAAQRYGQAPLLIVDYLQDLTRRRGSPNDDRRLAVAAMSDTIRQWAIDERGTALLVSSAARTWGDSTNSERSTRDFAGAAKESGDVDSDASGIVFVDIEPCPMGGTTPATLKVAKSRYGTIGEVHLEYHGAIGSFVPASAQAGRSALERNILASIKRGATTRSGVVEEIGGRRKTVLDAIGKLVADGIIDDDLVPVEGAL